MEQDNLYDRISELDEEIEGVDARIQAAYEKQITGKNVYQFLLDFDTLYERMTDLEKKQFMKTFIESIELYPEKKDNGRIISKIELRFPVYYDGQEGNEIRMPDKTQSRPFACSAGQVPEEQLALINERNNNRRCPSLPQERRSPCLLRSFPARTCWAVCSVPMPPVQPPVTIWIRRVFCGASGLTMKREPPQNFLPSIPARTVPHPVRQPA